jgi:hypothetical protein
MLKLSEIIRLGVVFFCSGVFWMMVLFLVEKVSMKRPRADG